MSINQANHQPTVDTHMPPQVHYRQYARASSMSIPCHHALSVIHTPLTHPPRNIRLIPTTRIHRRLGTTTPITPGTLRQPTSPKALPNHDLHMPVPHVPLHPVPLADPASVVFPWFDVPDAEQIGNIKQQRMWIMHRSHQIRPMINTWFHRPLSSYTCWQSPG